MKKLIEKRAMLKAQLNEMLEKAKVEERAFTEEESADFTKIEAEIKSLTATIEAEERAMSISDISVPAGQSESKETVEERAFVDYIRNKYVENRSDTNLTVTDNGAVIPQSIANKIISKVREICPIYSLATQYNVSGTLSIPYYDESTSTITVAYANEFAELESSAAKFKSIELGGFLCGALSKISKSLINNSNFDILGFIVNKMSEAFSIWLENELLKSTTNKIDGLKGVTQTITSATSTVITADELMDVQEEVPDVYQSSAIWIMSKAVRKKIRKLKDSDGNYLLNRDISAKWGYTLLGKDVYVSDNMPDATAGETAIYYGDFSGLAIKISENLTIEILREKFATQHVIGVMGFMEIDSKVENAQKISKLVMKSGT